MLIPSIFYGSVPEVRGRLRKVMAHVVQGASLRDALQPGDLTNTEDVPDALIWTNAIKSMRSAAHKDFRMVLLLTTLFGDKRLKSGIHAILEQAVTTFEGSAWETILLNANQGFWLGSLVRPNRRAFAAVLRGTVEHWDEFHALGRRFCSGGMTAKPFSGILVPAFPGVLSKLGVKLGSVEIQPEGIWTTEHAWADPRPMIHERGLIARVEQDDSFWATILRKVGGPPVDEEHIGEIKALCENGSWTREHWDLLRKTQGNESLEQAIGLIEAREDWNKLLGVLVHAVADMDRAADLFMRKRMDFGELNWARERIVEHLEKTAPEKAAELFFQDAEEYLEPGTSRAWRDTAKALTAAHDLLLEADLARVWAERLRAFRQKHGGCKVELTRFGGHPETRKSARGVFDGEAEAKSLYR